MTDLNGKTMLITGATDGIGRLTAEGLAAQSAQVLVHGRSEERIAQAVDEIARATGKRPRARLSGRLRVLRRSAGDG